MYVARNLWLTSSAQELETFPVLVFKGEYSERSAAAGDDELKVERNLLDCMAERLHGGYNVGVVVEPEDHALRYNLGRKTFDRHVLDMDMYEMVQDGGTK